MRERIIYKNHINETMEWGANGIYVNYNDLHDYAWNYESENNRISAFNKKIVKKTIPILIACQSEQEGLVLRNRLFEVCEKDVLAVKHGKLMIGDYYLKCFVTGSKKKKYLIRNGYMQASLTLTTDFPQWMKETTYTFSPNPDRSGDTENGKRNLDYPYDYPYDFLSEMSLRTVINSGFVPSNFKIIIYGACINPVVYISEHLYQVNAEVGENEYMTIDSMEKKIYITKNDGTLVNCFNLRNRESYIFEKIPPGANAVSWDGAFTFEIVLIDERSEPKWT